MAQRKNCIFIIITAYNRQYAAAFRYKAHKSEEKYNQPSAKIYILFLLLFDDGGLWFTNKAAPQSLWLRGAAYLSGVL